MNISPHFQLEEFVPKAIYDQYMANSIWFVDMRLVEGMEWIRSYFNASIIINNWHKGGPLQNRGYRPPNTTVGARLSQHKFGRACDFNVLGLKPDQVFDRLVADWGEVSKHTFFTTMEDKADTPSWSHIDLRCTKLDHILIVKP